MSVDIAEFYASNVGTNDWEEGIFGVDVLPSGERASPVASTSSASTPS